MSESFYAKGKLLLSGEYFVLDGALALALPCKFGQSLNVESFSESESVLHWKALDHENNRWFKAAFNLPDLNIFKTSDKEKSDRLQQILLQVSKQKPNFFKHTKGLKASTKLEFPTNWGLGSSSTLISLIAQWAEIDAFQLLHDTFGGSGYDIACADAESPLFYQLVEGKPEIISIDLDFPFKDSLYFVHLDQKQNSREGIKQYRAKKSPILEITISTVSVHSTTLSLCQDFEHFLKSLEDLEDITSDYLQLTKVKEIHFSDFNGGIKSLGAWGGDFVLVASRVSETETRAYFQSKGFSTILSYREMVYGEH